MWRQRERIDPADAAELTSPEKAELTAARRKIARLETQLSWPPGRWRRSRPTRIPKRYAAVEVIAARFPVHVCRVLGVSERGFSEQRSRAMSQRAVPHAWLTDLITQVHLASHGRYGTRQVHAELTMARRIEPTLWARVGRHPASPRPATTNTYSRFSQ